MPERSTAMHLWLVLMKAHRTMVRHAERSIEALDMCLSDFAVLELLLHKGPQKLTEIGRTIELTSGATTTAVDRLEARELVARASEEGDRRARRVSLTPQGEKLIRGAFAEHTRAMEQAASSLTKTERAALTQLLKKLGTSAEQQLVETPKTVTRAGAHR
jgi:MarR family transcriptional regulator, 2-MHQ and catechol-resistance regulon repressor